ncbi:hypothetical protein KKC87_01310, partial [Patescibacteria group bacterium]|nr:hypothetical protein [Patescibacteria group bacterium]
KKGFPISIILIPVVFAVCFLFGIQNAEAHKPVIVRGDNVQIENPEISRAFYDSLPHGPRVYEIYSDKDFVLYANLLVPENSNKDGRYSADIFRVTENGYEPIGRLGESSIDWKEFYEEYGGDYYLKGPEFKQSVLAGRYEIIVHSYTNLGKYVLAVGEKEQFSPLDWFKSLYILPILKISFFKVSIFTLFKSKIGLFVFVPFICLLFGLGVGLGLFLYRRKKRK